MRYVRHALHLPVSVHWNRYQYRIPKRGYRFSGKRPLQETQRGIVQTVLQLTPRFFQEGVIKPFLRGQKYPPRLPRCQHSRERTGPDYLKAPLHRLQCKLVPRRQGALQTDLAAPADPDRSGGEA